MCQNHYLTFGPFSDATVPDQRISRIALTQWFPGLGESPTTITTTTTSSSQVVEICSLLSELEEISEVSCY